MKYHHGVIYLKNESEPQLKVVCVDPAHKAGTRDQDCPIQDFITEWGWSYFFLIEGKKEIFKFDFEFKGNFDTFSGSGMLFQGEYTPVEGEVHPRGKPA